VCLTLGTEKVRRVRSVGREPRSGWSFWYGGGAVESRRRGWQGAASDCLQCLGVQRVALVSAVGFFGLMKATSKSFV